MQRTSSEDYYDVLQISKSATEVEIKKAYRKLAIKHHPDKNPDNKEVAEAQFKRIGEAYAILSDPEKRKRYDQFGKAAVDGSNGQGGFSAHNAEDIFEAFFGGQDPFAMFFQEAMAGGSQGNVQFSFGGPGMTFRTVNLGGNAGMRGRNFRRRGEPQPPPPPRESALRFGLNRTLGLCFVLWMFGVPVYMIWFLILAGTYFGVI